MPDRAQDTEAIRAATELNLPAMRDFANEMRAGTGDGLGPMFFRDVVRLVARLEAAERERDEAREGWDGWQERCFAVEEELAAALAAAAGETTLAEPEVEADKGATASAVSGSVRTPSGSASAAPGAISRGFGIESKMRTTGAGGLMPGAAPGETEQTP